MKKDEKTHPLNLNDILTLLVADIDIFLLQNKEQTADLDKVYTTEEIRNQLERSKDKIYSIIKELTFANIEFPLVGALNAYNVLLNTTLSDNQIIDFRHQLIQKYKKELDENN